MLGLKLVRFATSDEGTRGYIRVGGTEFKIMELPWRDNRRSVSCIPEGVYPCVWGSSPRFGLCYHVLEVPGRSHILFHHGNYAGDVSKGFRSDSNGCILVGYKHGKLNGQRVTLASKPARAFFESLLNEKPFNLTVVSE